MDWTSHVYDFESYWFCCWLFQVHPDFNAFDAVNCFLQFIPLEDEILDFFRPVASQILQQLRARPFLPTQPNAQGKSKSRCPCIILGIQFR